MGVNGINPHAWPDSRDSPAVLEHPVVYRPL